jgi:hypothetical protein
MKTARDTDPPAEDIAARDRKLALDMMTTMQRDLIKMQDENAHLRRDHWRLIQEKAERDEPSWARLMDAIGTKGCICRYDRALRWADRKILAGRTNEARIDANGKKQINTKAFARYLRRG